MIKSCFAFLILSVLVCSAAAQNSDQEMLRLTTEKLRESFANGKYDDALKLGSEALALSLKIYGADNQQTAVCYSNLGAIQKERKKFNASIEYYNRAVQIYQKLTNLNGRELVDAYSSLAASQYLQGKLDDAERSYLAALAESDSKFGKENKMSFGPLLNLANFFSLKREFAKADEYYLRCLVSASKSFGIESPEFERVRGERVCFSDGYEAVGNTSTREKNFVERWKQTFPQGLNNVDIVNARAISLPKPAYPPEARARYLSGRVVVRVTIDGQGNVVEAKPVCGNEILAAVSVESARKAKFRATSDGEKSIQSKGFIVYAFIAP